MKALRFSALFFFCLSIALASDFLTLREALSPVPGKVFLFGHNSYADFFYYLSMIQEGIRGKFLISTRYSTEPFIPQFAQPFFTLSGFLGGKLLGLSSTIIYWLSRMLGGSLLLLMVVIAAKRITGTKYWLVPFFAVFLSVPMWFVKDGYFYQWCSFWTGFDPLYRIAYLPHHVLANVLGFLALLLSDTAFRSRSWQYAMLTVFCLCCSILVNPAIALVYVLTLLCPLFLYGVFIYRKPSVLLFFIVNVFFSVLLYAHSYKTYTADFPWNITEVDQLFPYPIDGIRFLFVLGPMALVAMATIVTTRKWNFFLILLSVWFLLPIGIVFFFPLLSGFLPVVMVRFMQSVPYIPTGLLAAYGFLRLYAYMKKKKPQFLFTVILLAGFMVFLALPTYIVSVQEKNARFSYDQTHEPGFYISKESMDMMEWLGDHAKADDVILAVEPLSYMIPSYTHLIVPTATRWATYNYQEKRLKSYRVFTFRITEETKDFLDGERISYFLAHSYELPTEEFKSVFGFREIYRNNRYVLFHRTLKP